MPRQNRIQEILAEYRIRLAEALGENLKSVVLYGSQARGDAEDGSDIDLLCVMKDSFDYGDLIERTSEATSEISLKYDVVLSRTFVTTRDYESRNTPFLMRLPRNIWNLFTPGFSTD